MSAAVRRRRKLAQIRWESAGAPRRKRQALCVVGRLEFPADWKLEEHQYSSFVFLEMRVWGLVDWEEPRLGSAAVGFLHRVFALHKAGEDNGKGRGETFSDFFSESSESNWGVNRGVQPVEICHYNHDKYLFWSLVKHWPYMATERFLHQVWDFL